MTLHVPRLHFACDPLIAEAKRRRKRRRMLAFGTALVGAGAVAGVLAFQSPNGPGGLSGGPSPPGSRPSGGSSPTLHGHPLLVNRSGLVVFGPARHTNGYCPRLLPLPDGATPTVKRAVLLAMPPFEGALRLNGGDPRVTAGPAVRSGLSSGAGGCGPAAWRRSIVASVFLPHIAGASLSQHTVAVGRVRQGWVLWGFIH
jgi:hypothetical protein